MSRILIFLLPGVFLLLTAGTAIAQPSEKEIALEGKFIDAIRLKLTDQPDKAIALLNELFKENSSNAAVAFELVRLHLASKATL